MVMKFFAAVSIAVVLGFFGFRLVGESAIFASMDAGATAPPVAPKATSAIPVTSKEDPGRFLIHSQKDPTHNALRHALKTAANAYAASPCTAANKANLVKT